MAGEKIARPRNAADNGVGETTCPELVGHHRCDFVPKLVAEFFVDALVSDDGKLLGARREIKQDRVVLLSGVHPELLEATYGASDHVISAHVTSGDEDTDLAGRLAFGPLNCLNHCSVV